MDERLFVRRKLQYLSVKITFNIFSVHYGIYSVDFEDRNRTRTIKKSGEYIKQVIATRCVGDDGCTDDKSRLFNSLL